jgi:type I restriction-modification system DNA methylase subunit
MDGNPTQPRKAQLDKEEREHLEDIVTEMRDRVEANVRYQLEEYDVENRPDEDGSLSDEEEELVEAIELEAVDGNDWEEGYEQYITGVGYTIVNRLAALRCMEVRDFIDNEVTRFREDGLTPAANRLVTEEFMLEEEAVLEAYRNACDALAEEIEILFDRSSAYSLIDPDDDTYEDLCGMLDEVPNEVWRADDVLGWVYEYYNVKLLDDLRRKGDRKGLQPEDVPAANQFYTPHWVVRMLTDNSLGKLYLEDQGELQDTVERQDAMTPDERKNRPLSPDESPDISDFCTYLVPSEEEGEPPEFDGPENIRVIDPACGSGHFLLYAFDVLERIYRAETDLGHAEIPREILRNNLYGVDLDMRACQLAAFNLYLKGRTRAEAEGNSGFDMPEVGIVCADARVADIEGVEEVFDEVAEEKSDVENALRRVLDSFEEVHGLGSLLDVRGTLGDLFEDEVDEGSVQITLEDDPQEDYTLAQILHSLREAVEENRDSSSFLSQDLRSFVRLLEVLAQNYDVALMNPPYGSQNRMPDSVKNYIKDNYKYPPEFYINFFEVCNNVTKPNGRVGMLIKREFMFKKSYRKFREDFVGQKGAFDFLAEYGLGVLDNAHVRTVGTVVRMDSEQGDVGTFIRLHDVGTNEKEESFIKSINEPESHSGVRRVYRAAMSEFAAIPGNPLCYSVPSQVRDLHQRDVKLDAGDENSSLESIGDAAQGLLTGNNDRFLRKHWEAPSECGFSPMSDGGERAWILPHVDTVVQFESFGEQLRRTSGSRFQNSQYYEQEGLTWTYIKSTGRRFGYYPSGSVFGYSGSMLFTEYEDILWNLLGIVNSDLYHSLFLTLTVGRHWNPGEVGRVPWVEELEDFSGIEQRVKKQYELKIEQRSFDPTSPYYVSPSLAPDRASRKFYYDHPHNEVVDNIVTPSFKRREASNSISETALEVKRYETKLKANIEKLAREIDNNIFDELSFDKSVRNDIRTEIFLRTSENPEDREIPEPESLEETPTDLKQRIKNLVHHFAMEAVREEPDGIIPLEGTDEQADMHDSIVERFEDAYGGHAEDRLVEVDNLLGAESAADEAYPNLRSFIMDDLFAYHIDTMENTPIIWKLSTERLLADAKGEGFACFVDYHQLDASIFDRLQSQYLEPRRTHLRERRAAANSRRNDKSLSTSVQAEAAKEYERCESGLEQLSVFEEHLGEIAESNPREWPNENQERAAEAAERVSEFREQTASRLNNLENLAELEGTYMEDLFSPSFYETVQKNKDEWIDALDDLQTAFESYAEDGSNPVEAHLYDLFEYYDDLVGSSHYASNGILFMTYYFGQFEDPEQSQIGDAGDAERQKLLSKLAANVDGYTQLANEISEDCAAVAADIPNDWEERALSEVTTAGYQPVHKHGVAINIRPLAEKEIVPEIVEDKVL